MDEHLCVACTMCCDGSLFSRVRLTPRERGQLGDQPDFFLRDGTLRMRLPCAHLGADGACRVYETRPDVCRSYKCRLLKRVERGDVPESDARDYVRQARQLGRQAQSAARKALGLENGARDDPASIPDLRARIRDQADRLDTYLAREALYHLDAYMTYIRLHFRSGFLKSRRDRSS